MPSDRPDTTDLETLKAELRRREAQVEDQREELSALKKELASLRKQLMQLLQGRGGPPRIPEGQQTLFDPVGCEKSAEPESPLD